MFSIQEHKQNKNLQTSYRSGALSCVMTGFIQDYIIPFLLFLGGSAFHVGLLSGINNLASAFGQLPSPELVKYFKSRKKLVVFCCFSQALILLTVILLSLLRIISPFFLIWLAAFFSIFTAIIHPSWASLLSDMVPYNRRGAYFGWRMRNLGFLTLTVTLLAGCILHFSSEINKLLGFAALFSLALIARMISVVFAQKLKEPIFLDKKEDDFSLWDFLSRSKKSNFVHFVFFISSINFSVGLAAPFFAIFMLQDLKLNYLLYTLINLIAPVTLYLTVNRWGIVADRAGNIKILKCIAPLFSICPFLWAISQNILVIISAEIISGFLWAGFNLSTSNFIIDAVESQKRTRCITYFSLINGIALGLGAFTGSQLIRWMPALHGYKILSLFLLSAVLRITAGLIIGKCLKEVRPVEDVSSKQLLFQMLGLKPIAGIERKSIQF